MGIEDKKDDLEKKLEECNLQKNEYLSMLQRAQADLINYKKEEALRIKEVGDYIKELILTQIFPILDNLKKAEDQIPRDLRNDPNINGLLKIGEQIEGFLRNQGFERIEAAGKDFNPNFHEAVQTLDMPNEKSGKIIEEIQRGYILNGRVVRPARVKVVK